MVTINGGTAHLCEQNISFHHSAILIIIEINNFCMTKQILHFKAGLWSCKELEVFGWSQIFCPTPEVQMNHFLHHTPKLGIPIECYYFFWNFYWNRSLAVYHYFHWLLVATKFLTAKLHSRYVKELVSEILERSDILSPTPQPYFKAKV